MHRLASGFFDFICLEGHRVVTYMVAQCSTVRRDHIPLIRSSAHGHLDCCHLGAALNNPAMSIVCKSSCEHELLFLLGGNVGVDFLGCTCRSSCLSPVWLRHVAFPPGVSDGFISPHLCQHLSLSVTLTCCFGGSEVIFVALFAFSHQLML